MPAKPPAYADLADRMRALHATLRKKKLTVAVAESCTGGLLGAILSEHSGSSDYFRGGMEVYSDEAKTVLADVPPQLIHSHGAVSSVVAGALARGARAKLGAKIGLGITGIAGPTGATPGKPVGLVYIAIDGPKLQSVKKKQWAFDRAGNRLASVGVALDLLAEAIE
ncbi:MAG TPA: CinA family protein [Candidatus Saccharimonadales bacterium]|nr:CinA family protein [Candidatus Saccharimonadales bacterium]